MGESREVVCIRPQFDMAAALHNRMARSDSGNDLIAPENRFKQQVTVVMDSTQSRIGNYWTGKSENCWILHRK